MTITTIRRILKAQGLERLQRGDTGRCGVGRTRGHFNISNEVDVETRRVGRAIRRTRTETGRIQITCDSGDTVLRIQEILRANEIQIDESRGDFIFIR